MVGQVADVLLVFEVYCKSESVKRCLFTAPSWAKVISEKYISKIWWMKRLIQHCNALTFLMFDTSFSMSIEDLLFQNQVQSLIFVSMMQELSSISIFNQLINQKTGNDNQKVYWLCRVDQSITPQTLWIIFFWQTQTSFKQQCIGASSLPYLK